MSSEEAYTVWRLQVDLEAVIDSFELRAVDDQEYDLSEEIDRILEPDINKQ